MKRWINYGIGEQKLTAEGAKNTTSAISAVKIYSPCNDCQLTFHQQSINLALEFCQTGSIYFCGSLNYNMINLFLLVFFLGILVLLYFQWKVKRQQELLIKTETKALRALRKSNSQYIESGLFGLEPGNAYLKSAEANSGLMRHRKKVLIKKKQTAVY